MHSEWLRIAPCQVAIREVLLRLRGTSRLTSLVSSSGPPIRYSLRVSRWRLHRHTSTFTDDQDKTTHKNLVIGLHEDDMNRLQE